MHGNVSFLELGTSDTERSRPFFQRIFGWPFTPMTQGGGWFQAPSMRIGMHGGDTPQIYVFFEVADLEQAMALVREAGGEADPPGPEEPGFGRFSNCRDPQGMSFGLHQQSASSDEVAIRALITRWAQAVRSEDRAGIRADHDPGILMFDVPPPFLSRGLDAYMATWETFFYSAEKPVAFDIHDVELNCGADVAFATGLGKCVTVDRNGIREPLDFRLTMGLRKIDGRWRVMHEHHSLPA